SGLSSSSSSSSSSSKSSAIVAKKRGGNTTEDNNTNETAVTSQSSSSSQSRQQQQLQYSHITSREVVDLKRWYCHTRNLQRLHKRRRLLQGEGWKLVIDEGTQVPFWYNYD